MTRIQLFLLFTGVALAQAPDVTVREERVSPNEVMQTMYRYVLAGNEKDLPENLRRAQHFAELAKRPAANPKAPKRAQYLAQKFNELAACNRRLIHCLKGKEMSAFSETMDQIMKIEAKIKGQRGPLVEREWLTLPEIEQRLSAKLSYWTESPNVLPFALKHWDMEQKPRGVKGRSEGQKGKKPDSSD